MRAEDGHERVPQFAGRPFPAEPGSPGDLLELLPYLPAVQRVPSSRQNTRSCSCHISPPRAVRRPGGCGGRGAVGAENLCHLGKSPTGTRVVRSCAQRRSGRSWPGRRWDDLRLVGLKLIFLVVSRAVSLLRLSRREAWWKDAEILMLRHQLAVAERERPKARARLTWPDRAWLALLAGTVPAVSLAGMRLLVTRALSCAGIATSSAAGGGACRGTAGPGGRPRTARCGR